MPKVTDLYLRSKYNKPQPTQQIIAYRPFLFVRITKTGIISWLYRSQLNGNRFKLVLGRYPAMKISDAVAISNEYSELLEQGIDPRVRQEKDECAIKTYDDLFRFKCQQLDLSPKTLNSQQYSYGGLLKKRIGHFELAKATRMDYVVQLNKIKTIVSPGYLFTLFTNIKSTLNLAVKYDIIAKNPLGPLNPADIGAVKSRRTNHIATEEIGQFWLAINEIHSLEQDRILYKLYLIFGCRRSELLDAKKGEFDLINKVWTLPANRHKTGKKSQAPILRVIPKLAEQLIKQLPENSSQYLFPARNGKEQPLSRHVVDNIKNKVNERLVSKGLTTMTTHDIRRVCRNAWERKPLRFNFHVAESMLGHKVNTGVARHYLDYDYLDEQGEYYERWCEYILELYHIENKIITTN
ncbi:site-specific integrase [Vibrio sp. SS-MA-C1-2]|uniref:tyrosine-type recombinase/integrase n=1 Tax=Vibrio sp. SS-MA-C1-2 TaxID=2908646 RepID=UPI001F3792E3|nr:site-specific integrase [Vibrio sp. SS-MA-C1-2]UJF17222.1 site-specific integrase [Vibrio sp. SS-MA-C1-2]